MSTMSWHQRLVDMHACTAAYADAYGSVMCDVLRAHLGTDVVYTALMGAM